MQRMTCIACAEGQHDLCSGRNNPPPGMLGGDECDCDGNCPERARGICVACQCPLRPDGLCPACESKMAAGL